MLKSVAGTICRHRRFPLAAPAVIAAVLGLSPAALAQAPAASTVTPEQADARIVADLVLANHILADQGVVDAFGHISARSVKNPRHYYMGAAKAPALITAADIMEFDENSQAVDAKARAAYSERFIHGEIYRARPDVKSAIHSHSSEVLPFSLTDTPMVATISTAGFLGSAPTPVFDIRDSEGERNGTLVNTAKIGAAMAKSMGDRSVVLLRGHGMAVAGPDIPTTVFRAVYARLNAQAQLESLRLGKPNGLNAFEAERPVPPERPWELWVARVTGGGKP